MSQILRLFWEKISTNYSKKEDDMIIYELLVATSRANQGQRNVKEYVKDLMTMWKELDHH